MKKKFEIGPFSSRADADRTAKIFENSSTENVTFTVTGIMRDPHGKWYVYVTQET